MILSYFDIEHLSAMQEEKVTDDEMKMIQKKNGDRAMKICFPVWSVILVIAIVYTFVCEKEFPLFYILVLVFFFMPMSIFSLKEKTKPACYGTVIEKTIRCSKVSGRGTSYLPYEKTVDIGTYKHRYTLFETVCDFYYCTVDINGQIYENVCCKDKDFPNINIGDRVIIVSEITYSLPVVYKCVTKQR